MTREAFEGRSPDATEKPRQTRTCDECSSEYYVGRSEMASLCPECAHRLYGHPPCHHRFRDGRCEACYWDGSVSKFLEGRAPDR